MEERPVGHPDLSRLHDPVISIGVFAKRAGLSVSAIRKYEKEGLLVAHRTPSGRRLFSHEDLRRVELIQRLIQEQGLNIEGIRRMEAMLPCWGLLPCDEETRRSCGAYQETTRPCWTIKGLDCVHREGDCRECIVYRLGSLCVDEIKHLHHDPAECESTDRVICALRQRIRDGGEERAQGSAP